MKFIFQLLLVLLPVVSFASDKSAPWEQFFGCYDIQSANGVKLKPGTIHKSIFIETDIESFTRVIYYKMDKTPAPTVEFWISVVQEPYESELSFAAVALHDVPGASVTEDKDGVHFRFDGQVRDASAKPVSFKRSLDIKRLTIDTIEVKSDSWDLELGVPKNSPVVFKSVKCTE